MYDYLPYCFLLWKKYGLQKIVISPGSRSAPLVRACTLYDFELYVLPDERSAAFTALGMSQATHHPVALICTSGTATLNYAPAIAEAYFSNTALLVLTADRPPEWIDQDDGQTIFQREIYGKHVVKSFEMPTYVKEKEDYALSGRIAKEAISLCNKASVHINFPFKEPLYNEFQPLSDKIAPFFQAPTTHISIPTKNSFSEEQKNVIANAKSILIVVGRKEYDPAFRLMLTRITQYKSVVLIPDLLSNCHGISSAIDRVDATLHTCNPLHIKTLVPDLLITFGQSILSKPCKLFLRNAKISHHFAFNLISNHLALKYKDPFLTAPAYFGIPDCMGAEMILDALEEKHKQEIEATNNTSTNTPTNAYLKSWKKTERPPIEFPLVLSDALVMKHIMQALPEGCHVHFGNSMPVRYANIWGCKNDTVAFFANRGTCGIDGSVSTAIGHAMASSKKHLLVVGDMSFFYDRNSWWQNHLPNNFKVLLINNFGGGIFDLIQGPSKTGLAKKYFITEQKMCAAHLASEYNIDYILITHIDNTELFERRIENWLKEETWQLSILEIQTSPAENKKAYQLLFPTV